MDFFGIGRSLKAVMTVYFISARSSGRTTALIESVKNGDRLVFTNQHEAQRVKQLCWERGVTVECIVIDPRGASQIYLLPSLRGEGRTIFDHTWIEHFYMAALETTEEKLAELERSSSGPEATTSITPIQARERAKWKNFF